MPGQVHIDLAVVQVGRFGLGSGRLRCLVLGADIVPVLERRLRSLLCASLSGLASLWLLCGELLLLLTFSNDMVSALLGDHRKALACVLEIGRGHAFLTEILSGYLQGLVRLRLIDVWL